MEIGRPIAVATSTAPAAPQATLNRNEGWVTTAVGMSPAPLNELKRAPAIQIETSAPAIVVTVAHAIAGQ